MYHGKVVMGQSNNKILEIQNLRLQYSEENQPVLQNLDLSINRGERVSIIGPSGCGKTSLIHAVVGLLPYQGGSINLFGEPLAGVDPRCSMIFQTLDLLPWKSAWENGVLGARLQGMDPKLIDERGTQLFESLGIYDLRDKLPSQMSGGERQRVAIIRAIITDPECILMDEPFSALDEITRESIQDEVLKIFKDKTLILITHSIEEAVYLSTHIYWMDRDSGKLVGMYRNPDERGGEYRRTHQFYERCYELRSAMERGSL